MRSATALALDGGIPVRDPSRAWPRWPVADAVAEANVLSVLRGDRWTLTGPIGRSALFERQFARAFADYNGTRYCVPVDHGASALIVALDALDLDFGDRVLVPTLTWTASATAALRAGLVPVLTDVDPASGCVGVGNLDLDVDPRAIVAVHWSCAMADIPALHAVASPRGIEVVEDCAQAHGAEWLGQKAGSIGRVGCFSMQQGKVLTSGEGGAVITNDDDLAPLLEELRADSRRYRSDGGGIGEQDLLETATTSGANFCMSELPAAVLCAALAHLDAQHAVRRANFEVLDELVGDLPGVALVRPRPEQTAWSIYEVPIVFDELPGGWTNAEVAARLTAELGRPFYLTDPPLHRSVLFQPWKKRSLGPLAREVAALHADRTYPNADWLFEHSVVTHHSALLGTQQDMVDVASALRRVLDAGGAG